MRRALAYAAVFRIAATPSPRRPSASQFGSSLTPITSATRCYQSSTKLRDGNSIQVLARRAAAKQRRTCFYFISSASGRPQPA
ncbi:MAG: hypothetical protein ACKERG_03450 [Candidatus Hodgkinia cicadicola]